MQIINWKRGIAILLLVETFLFTIGVLIHEEVHSISFYILIGRFGEIHMFDAIAYRYNTIAVCVPPPGLIIKNTIPFELLAYAISFLITGVFAFILLKLFYYPSINSSERNKKSLMCLLVHARTNPDWEVSEQRPIEKERCKEFRKKDITQ